MTKRHRHSDRRADQAFRRDHRGGQPLDGGAPGPHLRAAGAERLRQDYHHGNAAWRAEADGGQLPVRPRTDVPPLAKLTSLRAAAALRIGLATLVMSFVLACGPPPPSDIAFVRWHDDVNFEIYVMNADGSGQTRLTDDPGFDGSPSWSPDGSRIAFQSFRDGDGIPNPEIYVMNADGSGQTRLTDNPGFDGSPSWSPDGGLIAFQSERDKNPDIYVMNADGSGQIRLTDDPEADWSPSWSPDGSRIAFESDRDGNFEIYVMNADGSGQTRLTDDPAYDGSPSWSPDGQRIAFDSVRDENSEIYVMNADGSGQTRLTDNPATDGSPSWSPQSVPGSRATPAP